MKLKLQIIIAAVFVMMIYIPVVQAQANPPLGGSRNSITNFASGEVFSPVSSRIDLLAPSDTTQTITQTGFYRITVRGADGGITIAVVKGGSGATVAATFLLEAGDVLTLVTGIEGDYGFGAGGGGGSAVILTRGGVSSLLIVAGAGGGGGSNAAVGGGGNSAQGIAGGGVASIGGGGGGGGFNAAGGSGALTGGGGAGTLSGGGAGGGGSGSGGYGFGGGGGGSTTGAPGGGGGYGGGNAIPGQSAAGGSSYVDVSGTNVTRTDGTAGGSTYQRGSVSVAATTAASVSISGRVLTSSKRGLSNALVYLTDSSGDTRTARTNSLGYYRFNDIAAGQSVTVTVVSKRYQFAPQIVNVTEEMNGLNFLAEQ